ncbi:DEAD/DEAH box helicase [Verrucomicrobiota bacterium]
MVKRFIKKWGRKIFGKNETTEKEPKAKHVDKPVRQHKTSGKSKANQSKPHHERWSLNDFDVPPKKDTIRFHDFNLPIPIMHAIHDLKFKYCTPIQAKVLTHASELQNISGRAQTGTGKTAAFLICIFARFLTDNRQQRNQRPGTPRALILAPTRELVMQITKDAQLLGKYCPFRCMAVYGGIDFEKQRKELERRPIDLIAATPGRLLDFKRRGVLDLKQVETLVIDEGDRMLDMGFIPDVSQIIRATPPKDKRQTMLFSATLTEDVLRLASQWMPDPVICEVDPEQVAVDTVKQITYMVSAHDKFKLLYNLLNMEKMERILIFGNRRDTTRRLTDNLKRHGIQCEYLSGAVDQDKRQKILDGFRKGRIRIVVATDVAGRGLHVDNITHVINYEFPYEPEDYVHRIGRTGRAGIKGTSISFACEDESFVIPEIEEYIGQPLSCTVPDPELLKQTPAPTAVEKKTSHSRSKQTGRPRRR